MNATPIAERLRTSPAFLPEPAADVFGVLNRHVDGLQVPQGVNEQDVHQLLSQLERKGDPDADAFWLILARLAEMALLCAGHYADNGAFDAAGDLLFNPQRIHIYQKGYLRPIVKPRRASVSDTLGLADVPADMRCRHLLHDTLVRVERGPLLPELSEKMIQSERFVQSYLDRFRRRMEQVGDAIAFLSAWSLPASQDVQKTLHCASAETRKFVFARLCRFQGNAFRQLGDEVDRLQQDPSCRSRFLFARNAIPCRPVR